MWVRCNFFLVKSIFNSNNNKFINRFLENNRIYVTVDGLEEDALHSSHARLLELNKDLI